MMDSEDDKAFKMNGHPARQIFKAYYEEIIRELNRILQIIYHFAGERQCGRKIS